MGVTDQIRDLSKLQPEAELACRLLFQECYKAGIKDLFVTETLRTQARQDHLYSLGRTKLYDEKGKKLAKVTWTLTSNHAAGLAFDLAVAPPKDLYDVAALSKAGAIAAKLGITWGGQASWVKAGKTDRPHFEVKKGWKPPAGYKLEGTIVVPSNSSLKVQFIVQDKAPVLEGEGIMLFSSETARLAVRDNISQMVEKGLIQKDWLEKFDKKTMTDGDYEGIKLIAAQREAAKK